MFNRSSFTFKEAQEKSPSSAKKHPPLNHPAEIIYLQTSKEKLEEDENCGSKARVTLVKSILLAKLR